MYDVCVRAAFPPASLTGGSQHSLFHLSLWRLRSAVHFVFCSSFIILVVFVPTKLRLSPTHLVQTVGLKPVSVFMGDYFRQRSPSSFFLREQLVLTPNTTNTAAGSAGATTFVPRLASLLDVSSHTAESRVKKLQVRGMEGSEAGYELWRSGLHHVHDRESRLNSL